MATYYDGLNDFHKLNEQNPLQSSAQLVYLHLLHLNNRLGNCGTVQVSDRTLGLRTSLNKNTITEAKRQLKNRGLIDFKTDRSKTTTYSLSFFSEKVGHSPGHEVGHTVGHEVGQPALFPIPARTQEEEEERKKKNYTTQPRGREYSEGIDTEERNEVDDLIECWEHAGGAKLNQLLLSELAALLKEHTMPKIKEAISKAALDNNNPNYGFSLNFVKLKLADIEKTEKGGERYAKTIDYGEEPDYSWIKKPQ